MYATLTDVKGRVRFRVQAPDYVWDSSGMLLLSLAGPEQAVRACWANIVKGRRERSVTRTQLRLQDGMKEYWVSVNPLLRYHSVSMNGGLVVLREEFNRLHNRFILGGDGETPSPWFEMALKQVPTMPYKKAWLPALWKMGIENGLIVRPEGQQIGISIWQIQTAEHLWANHLKAMVKEGALG